jgi:hypothetical protein
MMNDTDKVVAITPISDETVASMRRNSAMTLPDDPTAAGMKAAAIRRRLWESIFGAKGSLLSELSRAIAETNSFMLNHKGIASIEQKLTDVDGGENEITFKMTDGSEHRFVVKNGKAGMKIHVGAEQPTDETTIWIDTDEEASAEIDVVAKAGQAIVVKAVDADGKPTEYKAVDLPKAVPPNLAANEGEEGYVEGRTHYVDKRGKIHKLSNMYIDADWMATKEEHGGSVELACDITFTSEYGSMPVHYTPDVGYYDLDVYWNNTKYSCTLVTSSGEAFLGNRSLLGTRYPDTGEPFVFTGWALTGKEPTLTGVKKATSTAETVNLVITTHEYTAFNKMPEEYLPDGVVKRVNGKKPDASGNVEIETGGGSASIDVTASVGQTIVVEEVDADGKPTKWKAAEYPLTVTEIIPQTTFTGSYNSTYGCYMNAWAGTPLVAGKKYTVIFDGVEYVRTAKTGSFAGMAGVYFGNEILLGNDTGEPFCVLQVLGGESYIHALLLDGNEHTMTLSVAELTDAFVISSAHPYYIEVTGSGTTDDPYTCAETWMDIISVYNSHREICVRAVSTDINTRNYIAIFNMTDVTEYGGVIVQLLFVKAGIGTTSNNYIIFSLTEMDGSFTIRNSLD